MFGFLNLMSRSYNSPEQCVLLMTRRHPVRLDTQYGHPGRLDTQYGHPGRLDTHYGHPVSFTSSWILGLFPIFRALSNATMHICLQILM